MKKLLVVILAGVMMLSACNGDNKSSVLSASNDSETRVNATSSYEITSSSPTSEPPEKQNSATTQSTSINELTVSDNISEDISFSKQEPEASSAVADSNELPTIKEDTLNIEILIGEKVYTATLYDNETARAFKEQLPLTLDMSELNGNEKYYYLPQSLPTSSSCPSQINTGDIMLYGSNCLVIFYESFPTSYSYTPIGKIDDPNGLAGALGRGGVRVAFRVM